VSQFQPGVLQFPEMATLEEVKAAGEKAKKALNDLRAYAENPESQKTDAIRHLCLVEELTRSTREYINLISLLKR
jgi:hypothetical protein